MVLKQINTLIISFIDKLIQNNINKIINEIIKTIIIQCFIINTNYSNNNVSN